MFDRMRQRAERLTELLSIATWMPNRAHVEEHRNDLIAAAAEIERLTAALAHAQSERDFFRTTSRELRRLSGEARAALSRAEAQRSLPIDDETRQFADSALPRCMIDAGMDVLESADNDLKNYVPGETIAWDYGMIAVAVYRAMTTAFLETPDLAGAEGKGDATNA